MHPNIIRFIGFSMQMQLMIVMEFCSGGELSTLIRQIKDEPLEEIKLLWLVDAAKGLAYLHRKNIIHRDIKSENLLLSFPYGLVNDSVKANSNTITHRRSVGRRSKVEPESMKVDENSVLDLHVPEVKIADLGESRVSADQTMTIVGTPGYTSPEILQGQPCNI